MVDVRDVGLESVNFSFVEVHPGHEAAFNRWYERDHFYAGGVLGPGVISGRRWYSPKRLRDVRYVGDTCPFPDPTVGTNLATYFFTPPSGGDEFRDWVTPQLAELRQQGRMFAERTPVNIGFYTFDQVVDLPGAIDIEPHIALDRPFGAVIATFAAGGVGAPASGSVPDGTFTLGCTWKPQPAIVAQPDLTPFAPVRLLLTFVRDAPEPDAAALAAVATTAAHAAGATAMWASAFLPVIPGSDGFVEELR